MRKSFLLVWLAVLIAGAAWAASSRFIIDDDEYVDRVTRAGRKLLRQGKLVSFAALRKQPRPRSVALKPPAPAQEKIAPPELYERLRESTVAVGSLYRCPDCDDWHFNGSVGFVMNEDGVISTCCHVVLAEDKDVKESYLIAADSDGRVFPVMTILAADTESDTCLLKIKVTTHEPWILDAGFSSFSRCMGRLGICGIVEVAMDSLPRPLSPWHG